MFRFFVTEKNNNNFNLSKETLDHIKVARVQQENFICIYNGVFFECRLDGDKALILNKIDEDHELNGEVIVAAAIIDTKRWEWMIQKASELGATKIIPIFSKNVSKKLSGDLTKKIERWNKIAANAAEQSFRNFPPIVEIPMQYDKLFTLEMPNNKYIAHEKEKGSSTLFPSNSIFLIGPEGGFTDDEVALAKQNNFKVIGLGKRILRAETASIFVLSRIEK